MSIFSSILSKIFPSSHAANAPAPAPAGTAPAATAPAAAPGAAPISQVDVQEILDQKSQAKGGSLNWKTSIVDLLKLLDLDSSLTARKDLAKELSYTGSTDDSATMNIWLHRQVMNKLAANGGIVPADLKD